MKRKIEVIICILLIILLIFVLYQKYIKNVEHIKVFGYSFFIVKTGSMEPNINMGELIIVKENKEYNLGDVITYYDGNVFITHRVIDKSENVYLTKGDMNNEYDEKVNYGNIIGKVIFHSEILGKIITKYLKIIISIYIVVMICLKIFLINKNVKSGGNI